MEGDAARLSGTTGLGPEADRFFACGREREKLREGVEIGGGAGIRTPDQGIMIPLLYQLSYTAM